MRRSIALVAFVAALVGCTQTREPVPITPQADTKGAAVVRRPLPETAPASPQTAAVAPATTAREPAVVVPAGVLYVCVSGSGGTRTQTGDRVRAESRRDVREAPRNGTVSIRARHLPPQRRARLCSRGCRNHRADEAEYDKKVMRVRFKAN
jgi:hypothetical protein